MSILQEVLAGPQSRIYGPLPKVELPADDMLLSKFAGELISLVKNKGIYRRDNVPVVPYEEQRRLEMIDAQAFRSWVEDHVVCYKQKLDKQGDPFDVLRTMNRETADGVLRSGKFWAGLPKIAKVNPMRLPVRDNEGKLMLLEPGYDPATETLTFK